jgi:hypothetical protein
MPKLNRPQAKFLQQDTKFRAYVAGFGSGKTWVGCAGLLTHFGSFPGVNAAYYAPTYKLVRDVFYPTIDEVAYSMGFQTRIKLGDQEVHVSYNNQHYGVIHCRTLDNPANIVGFKSGHALVDELDILPTDKATTAWQKILARMRYQVDGLKNGVDVTTTPEGYKFTYDRFVKRGGGNYGLIQASTYENAKNLPDDYIATLKEDYPPQLIEAYLHGQFVNLTSGTVYVNYDRIQNRSSESIQGGEPLFVGMDFNVTRMAATIYVKRNSGKEWHAVEEIVDGYDTPEVIRILQERYPTNRITVYPDSTGNNRKSVGASISDISLLEGVFSVRANKSNPLVRDRILSVNSAFNKGVLFVNDTTCPTTAENLEQQVYDKNGEPDKKSGKDHQNDATGYPIAYEMPILKPVADLKVIFSRC